MSGLLKLTHVMRANPSRLRVLLLAAGALFAACYGKSEIVTSGLTPPSETSDPVDPPATPENGCKGEIDPDRPTLHRLNRAEYNNTVRDLLGDTTQPANDFPADDYGYGFDNIGDVLSIAPLLVEKYEAAAELLADQIVTRESSPPQLTTVLATAMTASTGTQSGNDWNIYSAGTLSTQLSFNSTATYTFRIRAYGDQAGGAAPQMALNVDGVALKQWDVTATSGSPQLFTHQANVSAGSHSVSVEFLNDYYDSASGADRNLIVSYVEVERPGTVTDPANAKLRICDPATVGESTCFRQIVTAFAKRAWRRPVSPEEGDRLTGMLTLAKSNGDGFETALRLAVQTTLLSPHFLFRVELDSDPASAATHKLNDYELASRLSYFLWSSTPDDALMQLADQGALQNPAALEAQVRRMLKDPKSRALTDNFAGQWLKVRALDLVTPDKTLFPTWDASLKDAMKEEARQYFTAFVQEDRPVSSMLDADFTYLNDRLADHYGLPKPGSTELQRVSLSGTNRGGLLTLGSILAVTSHSTRTSPVLRGKFVLTSLLCSEPPPPPANVPQITDGSQPTGTVRQQMEAHRANPVCASCHTAMDPIGFGMENFDAIGRHRTQDLGGFPIDSSGVLPSGQAFNGVSELAQLVKADPRLTECVANNLLTYAVGRGVTHDDAWAVQSVNEKAQARGGKLSDYLVEIALSPNFTSRRGEPEGGSP